MTTETDTRIAADDPRIAYMETLPNYLVGQRVIDKGADTVLAFATDYVAAAEWGRTLDRLVEYLAVFGLDADHAGPDSPGGPDYITIPIKAPANPDDDGFADGWSVDLFDAEWDSSDSDGYYQRIAVVNSSDRFGGSVVGTFPVAHMMTPEGASFVRGVVATHKAASTVPYDR